MLYQSMFTRIFFAPLTPTCEVKPTITGEEEAVELGATSPPASVTHSTEASSVTNHNADFHTTVQNVATDIELLPVGAEVATGGQAAAGVVTPVRAEALYKMLEGYNNQTREFLYQGFVKGFRIPAMRTSLLWTLFLA